MLVISLREFSIVFFFLKCVPYVFINSYKKINVLALNTDLETHGMLFFFSICGYSSLSLF